LPAARDQLPPASAPGALALGVRFAKNLTLLISPQPYPKSQSRHKLNLYAQSSRFVHRRRGRGYSRSRGAFMAMKMIETLLLARLVNVNPFDQPAVESYKEETRRILGSL
jgi:hypothetical protein